MNFLITGGSGRLGTELKKHLKGNYPTHTDLDITKVKKIDKCDVIVHMASYTNVDKAETIDRKLCFETNVLGTYNMLQFGKPFVFVSTEHVNSSGAYFESKLIGETLVKNLAPNYLIIRTIFKPNPWPWEYAFKDQYTQGDYVDIIAPLISKAIKGWDLQSKTIYVGTGRKTMYDLAKKTRPDVLPNSVDDLPLKRPKDYLP